jgi:two-component sensor histidine kinase
MIAQLQRLLAHTPQDGAIELGAHLREVCTTLVSMLSLPEQKVRIEHAGGECFVLNQYVQPIVLILCEIFLNAMKYAHPANVPLRMTIGCHAGADGMLVLEVEDDGVGMPDGFDLEKDGGLGFRLIRSLTTELEASLEIDSSPLGLAFRIAVPGAVGSNQKLA